MARPYKPGLNYFPLDTDMDEEDKIYLIEAEHGIEGFGILLKLLMTIYREGYYKSWSEKEELIFSRKKSIPIDSLRSVVRDAVKWEFFHQELFDTYGILSSHGIQMRYMKACVSRARIIIVDEYRLFEADEIEESQRIKVELVYPEKTTVDEQKSKIISGKTTVQDVEYTAEPENVNPERTLVIRHKTGVIYEITPEDTSPEKCDNNNLNKTLVIGQKTGVFCKKTLVNLPVNTQSRVKKSNINTCQTEFGTGGLPVDNSINGSGEPPPSPFEDEFNLIWNQYPRKIRRKAALKAFQTQRRKGIELETMLDAVKLYSRSVEGRDLSMVMHGSTFFGPDDPWEDYVPGGSSESDAGFVLTGLEKMMSRRIRCPDCKSMLIGTMSSCPGCGLSRAEIMTAVAIPS